MVETVRTEYGARTMAVDSKTHRLFPPSADFAEAPEAKDSHSPGRKLVDGGMLVFEP